MGVWDFIQDQVLGMKWLNELLGVTVPRRAEMIFAQIPRKRPKMRLLRSGGK